MNDEQIKAAKSLKRALKKCADAGLVLRCWSDVGVFVYPANHGSEKLEKALWCENIHDRFEITDAVEEVGMDVGCHNLNFDGGAGV